MVPSLDTAAIQFRELQPPILGVAVVNVGLSQNRTHNRAGSPNICPLKPTKKGVVAARKSDKDTPIVVLLFASTLVPFWFALSNR